MNSTDSRLFEKCIHTEPCFKGHFLDVHRDTVMLSTGVTATREYIKHPGAAAIIPLLGDEKNGYKIVLERQFRYPIQAVMIEIPAGKMDAADPKNKGLSTAKRELQEETGYTAQDWAYAGHIHPCLGYADEVIELWFAKNLISGEQHLDGEELLDLFTLPVAEFLQWCLEGKISDVKTLSAAFYLQNFIDNKLHLTWQN